MRLQNAAAANLDIIGMRAHCQHNLGLKTARGPHALHRLADALGQRTPGERLEQDIIGMIQKGVEQSATLMGMVEVEEAS